MGMSEPASITMRRCLAALALFVAAASGVSAADRPHIVYVLADDLGARDAGFRVLRCHDVHQIRGARGAPRLRKIRADHMPAWLSHRT